MNKTEILQHVAYNHNLLADMLVKGDNAIITGKVLDGLRNLASQLQEDIQTEAAAAQASADPDGEQANLD